MSILENETWTKSDLLDLAKRQKHVLWMIPVSLFAIVNPLTRIAAGIALLYFIYKLAAVLEPDQTVYIIVYMVLGFIPLVNLVALLLLSGQATKRLRANGIRVGLMGAKSADLEGLRASE